ncbi:MAG: HAMP domain-containing histidine kinase [Oscillospiraceae bacterium]|nr:HAMP domain-containing histidine kinase [Oscillospiraceae bacterium]
MPRLFSSVQFKLALFYVALIAGLLLFLNIYPIVVSRDLVRSAKEAALVAQAISVSQHLSTGALEEESIEVAIEDLNVQNLARIVVTDETGADLYDTAYGQGTLHTHELFHTAFMHVFTGPTGHEVFYGVYQGGSFYSWAGAPIMSGDVLVGAVFIHEHDVDQGALIVGIQWNLQNISIVTFVVALFVALLFSRTLTRRLKEMLSAIRMVGRGDYSYKLKVKGEDELMELSQAFNSLTDKLQETEEMRRQFVSDASHELKTPLASIRLLSDSIVQSADMEEGTIREFVEDIGQEAERLTRTTEKLLRLTRIDVQPETQLVPVDVAKVVRTAGHMLRPLVDGGQVEMTFALSENCNVLATEDDVYQIVFNLAENGIKYNVAGGTLHIRLIRDETQVYLVVEDTGIGIPEEDVPHIFDRFYRVDKARRRDEGGSGLGLSIVWGMVQQYGGHVDVVSQPGQGTRFTVTFPALM